MENDEFMRKLESLKKPEIRQTEHQEYLKIPLLNARKSAALGFWLVVIPCFFLFCVVMKYYFHSNGQLWNTFIEMVADLDNNSFWFFGPVFLLIFPLLALVLNLLSILHFSYDKPNHSLVISIKLSFWNIVIIIISAFANAIIAAYVIAENFYL